MGSGLSAGLAGVAAAEAVTRDSGVERSGNKETGTTSAQSERLSSVPGRTQAVRAAASPRSRSVAEVSEWTGTAQNHRDTRTFLQQSGMSVFQHHGWGGARTGRGWPTAGRGYGPVFQVSGVRDESQRTLEHADV